MNVAVPCGAGQYSPHGKSECIPCREGFFQPNPGSSNCFRCPKGHSTIRSGARSQMECILDAAVSTVKFANLHWIIVGSVLGVLALIGFIVFVVCCCPNSCLGKCFCCVYCRNKKSDENDLRKSNEDEKPPHGWAYEKLIDQEEDDESDGRIGTQTLNWELNPLVPHHPKRKAVIDQGEDYESDARMGTQNRNWKKFSPLVPQHPKRETVIDQEDDDESDARMGTQNRTWNKLSPLVPQFPIRKTKNQNSNGNKFETVHRPCPRRPRKDMKQNNGMLL